MGNLDGETLCKKHQNSTVGEQIHFHCQNLISDCRGFILGSSLEQWDSFRVNSVMDSFITRFVHSKVFILVISGRNISLVNLRSTQLMLVSSRILFFGEAWKMSENWKRRKGKRRDTF